MDEDAVETLLAETGFSSDGIRRALRSHEKLGQLPLMTFGELEFLAQCIEARDGHGTDAFAMSLLTAIRETQYSITRGSDEG